MELELECLFCLQWFRHIGAGVSLGHCSTGIMKSNQGRQKLRFRGVRGGVFINIYMQLR